LGAIARSADQPQAPARPPAPAAARTVFDGVPAERLTETLDHLERLRFPAGSTVMLQGDPVREVYVVLDGMADVFFVDSDDVEHRVGRVLGGGTIGEMALFTGQPASGTVRAATDLDVVVLGAPEFERLADEHPVIYRNLGAILSDRLARTNRLAAHETGGKVLVLRDLEAPPLLAFALAASIAWHTRDRTLLLVADEARAAELAGLLGDRAPGGADVQVCEAADVGVALEMLSGSGYVHVLVLLREDAPGPPGDAAPVIKLCGSHTSLSHGDARFTLVPGRDVRFVAGAPLEIPPLTDEDVESLRTGVLPSSSAAGNAIGRVARELTGLTVGLALGSGSVRGFAHWGVLRVLERVGLRPDYVAGTSVGAAVGSLYALGKSLDEGVDVLERCGETLVRYGPPPNSLLSNRGVRRFIQGEVGDIRIEELQVPLALVAADILTQQEIVFRTGLLWQAIVASLSIPGVYPALRIGEHLVVDGGVLNPVPVSVAADMGADVVLAVKLVGDTGRQLEAESVEAKGRPPSAINVIMRSVELMQGRISSEPGAARTITVAPRLRDIPTGKLRGFSGGGRFVELGEEAAEEMLPRIMAALPWLRPEAMTRRTG
jgi:NTE family protein